MSRTPRAPREDRTGLSLGRRLLITIFSAFVTLMVIAVFVTAWAVWSFNAEGPTARVGQTTTVVLKDGAGLNQIAEALEREGVVRSGPFFAVAARISGSARSLKAGEYEFPSRISMAGALQKIARGQVVRHSVTIPEGVTSDMAVEILMANPVLTGPVAAPPEGAILPDTYDVRRGEERAAVLERMMAARDALLTRLWAQRQQGLPFNSMEEAVILASIVEKETAKPSERPMIARVFINRLEKGMRLQSDPTIIYGITRGRPLGRGIRMSELQAATPYNTYAIDGMTPTPIANPGREALAAVLDPPKGDWIFFVADGTGGHAFATTLADHNANVATWRQIERKAAGPAPSTVAPPVTAPAPEDAPVVPNVQAH